MLYIKKLIAGLVVFGCAATAIVSCGHSAATSYVSDFNDTIYAPSEAGGFVIMGNKSHRSSIINVFNPWQGADSVVTKLFISRDGEIAPEGFDGCVIDGDARRIVAMSSTDIAMLDAIGAVDRVVGVSGLEYISNPHISAGRDTIGDVGFDGSVNYELIVSLNPDLVLLYGINGASSMERKLEELGIPYLYIGDYLEESPLGKAEWMVVLGELTGLRDKAADGFIAIRQRYEVVKALIPDTIVSRPLVMLNAPYGDSWFLPPSGSYMVRLISDAGGDYVFKRNISGSSVAVDIEEAYMLASQADVWLNAGDMAGLQQLSRQLPKFADIKSVGDGKVFSNDRRRTPSGGNDFFEGGVVNPDVVLLDLVKILHPGLIQESDLYYYRQLQ